MPQQITCPTNLKVFQSNLKTRAKFGESFDSLQTLPRIHGHDPILGNHEVSICLPFFLKTPDTAAKLIKIGQAKKIGPIDKNGIHIRNVDSRLNNVRGKQAVDPSFKEILHDGFQHLRLHLSVSHPEPDMRHQRTKMLMHFLDGGNPVVNKVNLTGPAPAPGVPPPLLFRHHIPSQTSQSEDGSWAVC